MMKTGDCSARSWRRSLSNVAIAIIHHPVIDKRGDLISTSITNLELHDAARCCMTFGVDLCYIVTPLPRQRGIAERLMDHWLQGYGLQYNPDRAKALRTVRLVDTLEAVTGELGGLAEPVIIGTSSHPRSLTIGYGELRSRIQREPGPFLILFGTAWGLPDSITDRCERMLMPIRGEGDYNHLSLRVAIGIVLDRLLGERGGSDE